MLSNPPPPRPVVLIVSPWAGWYLPEQYFVHANFHANFPNPSLENSPMLDVSGFLCMYPRPYPTHPSLLPTNLNDTFPVGAAQVESPPT